MNDDYIDQRVTVIKDDWLGIFKHGDKNKYTFDGSFDSNGTKLSNLLNRNREEQFNNKNFSGGFTFSELILTLEFMRKQTPLPLYVELWLARKVKEADKNEHM